MAQPTGRIDIPTPQTTMYDLDDVVLRETFGHFTIEELTVMADVCSTYRRVAREEFASRHMEVVLFVSGVTIERNGISEMHVEYPHLISILRKFGRGIKSVCMNDGTRHELLKSIAQYCG